MVGRAKAAVACGEAGALEGEGGAVGGAVLRLDDGGERQLDGGVSVVGGVGRLKRQHGPRPVDGDLGGDEAGEVDLQLRDVAHGAAVGHGDETVERSEAGGDEVHEVT